MKLFGLEADEAAHVSVGLKTRSLADAREFGTAVSDVGRDLAGYDAKLAMFIAERRPSQRALRQAYRTLKLTKVHLPAIAEVIAALNSAEQALQANAARLAAMPEPIPLLEAVSAHLRAAPTSAALAAPGLTT